MSTSHHADGADRFVRSASASGALDFCARPANDNRVPEGTPLPYARGVVLAMGFDAEDQPVVSLHLLLAGGEVGVAFHTARHDYDVIALWRGLGRDFNLPLYLCSSCGHLSAVNPEMGGETYARRTGSPLSARRPRFLARRRMPLEAHALADGELQAENA